MPTIRQTAVHLQRCFSSLPTWAVSTIASVLLLAFTFGLWQHQHAAPSVWEVLWNGQRFADSDLGPMLRAFAKEDLKEYAVKDGRIRVPRRDVAAYLAALAKHDALPRGYGANVRDALAESRLFETERDRRRRVSHALDMDLAAQICAMPGIENATVYYDEREERGFHAQTIFKASVSVVPEAGYLLNREQIHAIRTLVAGARPGLEPSNVSVTDLGMSRAYVGGMEDVALIPRAEDYLRLKLRIEQDWQRKVRAVLRFVPTAQVVVDVELPADDLPVNAPIGKTLEPRRLAVSVGIPLSHYVSLWRSHHPADSPQAVPTKDELQEIRIEYESRVRRAVLAVLPDHVDAASAVTVTSFDEPVPATNPPWIDVANWQRSVRQQPVRVAVVAVACVVVLACATMLRKRRPERVLEPSTIPMNGYQPASSEARLARLDSPAEMDESQLRETLANLVREDPDGAAKILHRWLDRAG